MDVGSTAWPLFPPGLSCCLIDPFYVKGCFALTAVQQQQQHQQTFLGRSGYYVVTNDRSLDSDSFANLQDAREVNDCNLFSLRGPQRQLPLCSTP